MFPATCYARVSWWNDKGKNLDYLSYKDGFDIDAYVIRKYGPNASVDEVYPDDVAKLGVKWTHIV